MAKATKLTAMEKRAQVFAQEIETYGNGRLAVIWKKSATWGFNPSVEGNGQKVGYASGCGYCKKSAALAVALQFLGKDDEEQRSIRESSGCGVETLRRALESCGYELQELYKGKREDSYRVIRKTT